MRGENKVDEAKQLNYKAGNIDSPETVTDVIFPPYCERLRKLTPCFENWKPNMEIACACQKHQ